jgi:carboxypeptidase D
LKQHKSMLFKQALKQDILERRTGISKRDPAIEEARFAKRAQWKRDLTGRANGTIDPWYECDLYDEMIDYAVNFSLPWRECCVVRPPSWT